MIASKDVHKIVREVLGPWCKAEGYKRTRTSLGWMRPVGDGWMTFWVQLQQGWQTDPYAGSAFLVEFQLAPTDIPGGVTAGRERIWRLLSASAMSEARHLQNSVIGKLPRPPGDWLEQLGTLKDSYLRQFSPLPENFELGECDWFRYFDAADVRHWSHYFLRQIPRAVSTLLAEMEIRKDFPRLDFRACPRRSRIPMVGRMVPVPVADVARLLRRANGDLTLTREAYEWLSDDEFQDAVAYGTAFPREVQENPWSAEALQGTRWRWGSYGLTVGDPARPWLDDERPWLDHEEGPVLSDLLDTWRKVHRDLLAVQSRFPHLRLGQVLSALAFAEDAGLLTDGQTMAV